LAVKKLQFTLGPVQGFVARARKTRDFWSGSFILSSLAGYAMLAVIEAGGKLIMPAVTDETGQVTDPLLAAARERSKGRPVGEGPFIATLPNRFQAEIPDGFNPESCVLTVQKGWSIMVEPVWDQYIAPIAALGNDSRSIWERQINGFWEMSWVIGEDPALLDRRKNWRSYVPPVEPGDKCTLMGNLQEISGYTRARERGKQDAFWVTARMVSGGFELDEDERFCAIALVKLFFPLVAKDILWKVPDHYPSTPYLAAASWISRMVEKNADEVRGYASLAKGLPGASYKEDPEILSGVSRAVITYPWAKEFASLDGNCFFASALQNPRLWAKNSDKVQESRELCDKLRERLEKLAPPASPFYAMLLMDGDRLGSLLRKYDPRIISEALGRFSQTVQDVVKKHGGITVFAGGDDVLALFPLEGALPASVVLREAYINVFPSGRLNEIEATISGTIVYAHYSTPLAAVYREAHQVLDGVAKERTGRDSLAVSVWKRAGRVLTWSAPWDIVKVGSENIFDTLVNSFQDDNGKNRELNSSFFYNLRSRFEILTGQSKNLLSDSDIEAILVAEYIRNRERECSREEARERMKKLLQVCGRYWRDEKGKLRKAEGILVFDGALLVKFLAEKGVY
jgi:CRISPR-associated protein Cmr2